MATFTSTSVQAAAVCSAAARATAARTAPGRRMVPRVDGRSRALWAEFPRLVGGVRLYGGLRSERCRCRRGRRAPRG